MQSQTTLSEEQINSYHATGYLMLRGVFGPDEVAAWRAESDRLLHSDLVDENNIRTWPKKNTRGELEVERVDPVIDVSPVFNGVIYDERITGPLRDLFGEDAVLFKDKLIFKNPGMTGYSMHQDYSWWQHQPGGPMPYVPAEKILSVMVAIDAADEANGAIQLFPGYHARLLSTEGELRNMNAEEIKKIDQGTGVLGKTQAGDVTIFHSLTPHCSEPNRSDRSRRQLYMTYNAASAGDHYAEQQQHYRNYTIKGAGERASKVFFR